MTSLLRELVPVPIVLSLSTTMTSRPPSASALAMARPTTPAPIMIASTCSAGTDGQACAILDVQPGGRSQVLIIHRVRLMGKAERQRNQRAAGWKALERNELRPAEEIARAALRKNPRDRDSLSLLGASLFLQRRFQEAVAPLSEVFR